MPYEPSTQREWALVHIGFVPPINEVFRGPDPTTTRPTRPAMPDGLTGTPLAQVETWLLSQQDAASDALVTEATAITKRDAFKSFFAADRAWQMTREVDRHTTWHGMYVDSLMRNHNEAVVPPSQTSDGVPVNPQTSPVPRNED